MRCVLWMVVVTLGCAEPVEPVMESDGPFVQEVVSFSPGVGAGFGGAVMPDVILGPPKGSGENRGGLDVLSLGAGGELVLGFGERHLEDGPGPDFVVFENAFRVLGAENEVFADLAEVSVSEDGESWSTFPCDPAPNSASQWPGCAGWRPVLVWEDWERWRVEDVGGDAFDLADLGVSRARFVRLRDLSDPAQVEEGTTSAGFDLDAIGLIER